jgi:hypothetical protein
MPALVALLPTVMNMLNPPKAAAAPTAPPPGLTTGEDIAIGFGGIAVLGILAYAVLK